MARLPNTATAEERKAVHDAKMAGKIYNRAKGVAAGRHVAIKRNYGLGSLAGRNNRHTGLPHTHAREIARRTGAAANA